mmetsp:Transcript_21607/g.58115  ORF Transcript_21607/g.58115 Transcript_21607/m.58115 type:complete len:229 (-) Transcript_21607:2703-3389(-)
MSSTQESPPRSLRGPVPGRCQPRDQGAHHARARQLKHCDALVAREQVGQLLHRTHLRLPAGLRCHSAAAAVIGRSGCRRGRQSACEGLQLGETLALQRCGHGPAGDTTRLALGTTTAASATVGDAVLARRGGVTQPGRICSRPQLGERVSATVGTSTRRGSCALECQGLGLGSEGRGLGRSRGSLLLLLGADLLESVTEAVEFKSHSLTEEVAGKLGGQFGHKITHDA